MGKQIVVARCVNVLGIRSIELAFAKLKALLRAVDDLWNRLKPALDAFTPTDCQNFFKHTGYA